MKTRTGKYLLLTALVGSLMLVGSGCSKKSVIPPESTAGVSGSAGASSSYPAAQNGGYSEDSLPIEGTLDDTAGAGAGYAGAEQSDEYKRSQGRTSQGLKPIFFDFDSASVRPNMVETMLDNAQYLKQVNSYVVVEGNTDERGTNEYNLALGERRAQNTRQYLIDLGISSNRIRTITYGEEKPLFEGSDEEAYQYNRRADFIIE